jgi:antitoxin ParD1/3/4
MEVALPEKLAAFVQNQVKAGKYASPGEVILAGVMLLEEREQIYQNRFEELQQEVMLGVEQLDQGERLDGRTVIEQLRQKNQTSRQLSS